MSSASTLVITRVLPASPARVFAAWTDADIMKQWFCPSAEMTVPVAEVDARPGGEYQIVMENKEGETHSPSGTYETVIENEKLVFSWKWSTSELVTRVTIDLRELDDNLTELTLTHEGFPEESIRDQHNQGWDGCLNRLELHLH